MVRITAAFHYGIASLLAYWITGKGNGVHIAAIFSWQGALLLRRCMVNEAIAMNGNFKM